MKMQNIVLYATLAFVICSCEGKQPVTVESCQQQVDSVKTVIALKNDSMNRLIDTLQMENEAFQANLAAIRDSASQVNIQRKKPRGQVFRSPEKGKGAKLMDQ
jgi:hypothetical protein